MMQQAFWTPDGNIQIHTTDGDAIHISTIWPGDPGWTDALLLAGPTPDAPMPPEATSLDRQRALRDSLLAGSDWTQLPDAPLSEAMRAEWRAYRQTLRDLPDTITDPADIIWPQPPHEE